MLKYIVDNARWCINRQYYQHMLGKGMSVQQMYDQLNINMGSWKNSINSSAIDVHSVRFALNDISLTNTKCPYRGQLVALYDGYYNMYRAVLARLAGVSLPSDNSGECRVDSIVQLYMSATQGYNDTMLWNRYKDYARSQILLNDKELQYIDDILLLNRCRYYCAVCRYTFTTNCAMYIDNLSNSCALTAPLVDNSYYSNTTYDKGIGAVVDCFGASSVVLGAVKTDCNMSMTVSANGRNVLDTFCQHLYGDNMALFFSVTNSISASMMYRVSRCSEMRCVDIVAGIATKQRYSVLVSCNVEGGSGIELNSFVVEGCNCISVSGSKQYYVAYALVSDNQILENCTTLTHNGNSINVLLASSAVLGQGQKYNVSVVTMYGNSISDITKQVERISCIGYCNRMPLCTSVVNGSKYDIATNISACSNMYSNIDSTSNNNVHNYTYQFGDCGISTLLDNNGNGTTMLDGFAFCSGEKLYYHSGNKISRINCGRFAIDADGYQYCHQCGSDNVKLGVRHCHAKVYNVSMPSKGGMLAIFPLEQQSAVRRIANGFDITSRNRHFALRYSGVVDSFTTNSIECNDRRLRRHLSGDIDSGNCLAINFKGGDIAIEIVNCNKLPISKAVVRESLLSTYLNYINNKNMYLAVNKLRGIDALTLSAMVYTNMNYVWQCLLDIERSGTAEGGVSYFYDTNRKMIASTDSMVYPLALLYYVTVSGNTSVLNSQRISRLQYMLYDSNGDSRHMCLVALALKKLSKLNIDKVNVLMQYSNVKKIITSDKNSYAYAQAIGAVGMVNPSKQRLKNLVAKCNIPKCFYYVSQLENLYGIELVGSRLSVKPSQGMAQLEQLLLQVGSSKINALFDKTNSYQLCLNGNKCFHAVDVDKLDEVNTLLVNY